MSVAVVTGAASGIGRATAEVLIASGWTVLALDIVQKTLTVGDAEIDTIPVDISDRAALRTAINENLEKEASISLVANIAGVFPPTTIKDYDLERYRRVFDVNVLGVLNVIAESSPRMQRGGAIVNIASVDAFTVSPGQLLYGASKAAVVMLTKSLALEFAHEGIRVNAIAPGWVDTPGNRATGRMDSAAASIPLGRVAQPSEIARWVEILASKDAGFLTGETIVLSGGDVIR